MPSQTYPDGFPQNPVEAIDFSYFLSDEEKTDWKQWLESATAEQQYELVDTLHAMWQENQKSAVPNGFNQTGSQTGSQTGAVSGTQSTTSTQSTQDVPSQSSTTASSSSSQVKQDDEDEFSSFQSTSVENNNDEYNKVDEGFQTNDETFQDSDIVINNQLKPDDNQRNNANSDSAKVEDQQSDPQKNNQSAKKDTQKQSQNTGSSKTQNQNDQSNQNQKANKPYFNVTKLRESATRQELESLYQEYVELRESNFTNTYSFYEAQGKFLDKIMAVVVNFEQVADFFDSVSQKIIELNDRLVSEVKDFNSIKGNISAQQGDILDQLEHLRNDVDRLYRTTRDDKSYNRSKFEEINTQLASIGADTYSSGPGLQQRFDLLTSKIHKLELDMARMKSSEITGANNTVSGIASLNSPKAPTQVSDESRKNSNGGKTSIKINT